MNLKSFNINRTSYSNNLSKSLILWLDHNFFQEGAYFNTSGNLYVQDYPGYPNNRVYGSNRKNWVWQSGSVQVNVNGSPVSGYSINYPQGLVVFDSAPAGTVSASYSYKRIHVVDAEDNKFFRGRYSTFDVYSGVFREDSLQLPSIVVESDTVSSLPNQLGSYTRDVRDVFVLNVFHRNANFVKRITDLLHEQVDNHVDIFDFDRAYKSGDYPLEFNGFLINSLGNYEYLVQNHPYNKIRNNTIYIENSYKEKIVKLDNNLWQGNVRFETLSEYSMGIN